MVGFFWLNLSIHSYTLVYDLGCLELYSKDLSLYYTFQIFNV
jgi:hypothetical protein